jgi:hypothetical protein
MSICERLWWTVYRGVRYNGEVCSGARLQFESSNVRFEFQTSAKFHLHAHVRNDEEKVVGAIAHCFVARPWVVWVSHYQHVSIRSTTASCLHLHLLVQEQTQQLLQQ